VLSENYEEYSPSEQQLLAAERQLLEALRTDGVLDLIPGVRDAPSHEEVLGWTDPARVIRFETLRPFLLRVSEPKPKAIILRGAIIEGSLDLAGAMIGVSFAMASCRINDVVNFREAKFLSDVSFSDSVFTERSFLEGAQFFDIAEFRKAKFSKDAEFDGVNFRSIANFAEVDFAESAHFEGASFGRALFRETKFGDHSSFNRARFEEEAFFEGCLFVGFSRFQWAKFYGGASFRGIKFEAEADFAWARFLHFTQWQESEFSGQVEYGGAVFEHGTSFATVVFSKNARFDGVTFADRAEFYSAIFEGDADFRGPLASSISFNRAEFHASQLGPMAAEELDLREAVFHRRVRLVVLCSNLSAINSHVRAGGHLQIHSSTIDATDAEFIGHTIVSDPGPETFVNWEDPFGFPGSHHNTRSPVRDALSSRLTSWAGGQSTITSLVRANITDLTLSAVDLSSCNFQGAHGLDEVRFDSTCRIGTTPIHLAVRRPIRFTQRRVIAEERTWRRRHATWDRQPLGPTADAPSASEIGDVYRGLRKGLEDSKNEPGAADFYYGEMEMRRLSARDKTGKSNRSAWVERWLLNAYWAVSGYGLRASRAFTALAILILISAVVFANGGLTEPQPGTKAESVDLQTGAITYPPGQEIGFRGALELAARNSMALLRNPGTVREMTPVGTWMDITLRLLAPVLLGFALLALRGRTKR
jgi:uncharacterized protein YjbI with pentapeptide repeats